MFVKKIKPIMKPDIINVLCMTLFWLDGYDPNTSTKGNRDGAWAGSRTFVLYDIKKDRVYFVDSVLFTAGPGKGKQKENHACIFQKMLDDKLSLEGVDGTPIPLPLVSSYHGMKTVDIYVCHIGALMDNPE